MLRVEHLLRVQHPLDRGRQLAQVKLVRVLAEIVARAAPHQFGGDGRAVAARQHHHRHRDLAGVVGERREEFEAGLVGQVIVEQHAVGLVLRDEPQPFAAGLRLDQHEVVGVVGGERAAARDPVDQIVVHQQCANLRLRHRVVRGVRARRPLTAFR